MHTENREPFDYNSTMSMANMLDSPSKSEKAVREANIKSTINICRMTQQMIDVNLTYLERLRNESDVTVNAVQQDIRTLEVNRFTSYNRF